VRVPDPSEMRDALRIPQAHLARLASLAHPTPKPESPR
jgi:hypothetical protein